MSLPRLLRSNPAAPLTSLFRNETLNTAKPRRHLPRRCYSIKSDEEALKDLPGINPSKLVVTESITPKELIPHQDLVFGRTFTGKPIDSPMHLESGS